MAGDPVAGPKSEQDILNAVFDSDNKVLKTNTTVAADIEIGSVEIKDASTDSRADVNDASTSRAATTHVLAVQNIDNLGEVLESGRYSYSNVTASGATVVKSTAGFLHSLTFNKSASEITTVVYDASGIGTIVGTVVTGPSAVAQAYPFTLTYDVKCLSGITLSQVSAVATGNNITVSYR